MTLLREMGNLYQILGVSPTASQQEIRSAFRKLALTVHPDVNHSPTATDEFLRISEAYRILSDRRLRRLYDQGVLVDRDEYLRQKLRRQMVERHIDEILNELLRQDEEETLARQITVTTLVALFFSAFIAGFVRPPIFEAFGLVGQVVCLILAGLGVRELVKNIRFSLKYYTFDDEDTISLRDTREPPNKPFTRMEAWMFLVGGFLGSLGLGLWTRYLVGESRFLGQGDPLLGVFLLPPMFVYLVSRVRVLGLFQIDRIKVS